MLKSAKAARRMKLDFILWDEFGSRDDDGMRDGVSFEAHRKTWRWGTNKAFGTGENAVIDIDFPRAKY